jgi:hypothetical protein
MKTFGNLVLMTLICVAIFMVARPADAQNVYPPPEYDYRYQGELFVIEELPWRTMRDNCLPMRGYGPYDNPLACTIVNPGGLMNRCVILLAKREYIERDTLVENLFRHEQAHCNGWPWDHPGGRHSDESHLRFADHEKDRQLSIADFQRRSPDPPPQ